jgi:hypothetical protein
MGGTSWPTIGRLNHPYCCNEEVPDEHRRICTEPRSPSTPCTSSRARRGEGGSGSPTGTGSAGGCTPTWLRRLAPRRRRWRWRAAPAGGTWWRRSPRRASRRSDTTRQLVADAKAQFEPGGPSTDNDRLSDDRRHRRRSPAVETRSATRFGTHQPACRALAEAHYGIGGLIAVAVWSELGDCRRFSRSDQVVRHTGRDVTVDSSDRRRAGGFLARQGPRRCAGRCTRRPRTPRTTAAPTTSTTPR